MRKWIEEEGKRWVEKGIITEEQKEQIAALYPYKKSAGERLPIFAAILVGAGILTFVASNWSAIPQLLRLCIILAALGGFYVAGYRTEQRGSRSLGVSLLSLGVITFGAGIFLTGQMFHLVAYDARAFIIWSLPAVILALLYRGHLLYFLTLFILHAGQLYSTVSFGQFSWLLLIILVVGAGAYALRSRERTIVAVWTPSVLLHVLLYLISAEHALGWFLLVAAVLYAGLDFLPDRHVRIAGQLGTLTSSFFLAVFFIFFLGEMDNEPVPSVPLFFVLFIGSAALSLLGKRRHGETVSMYEWVIFLPFFYWPGIGDVLYLLALFVLSGYLLWSGYREEWSGKVTMGTLLFLLSTFIGYIQVAWSFLPKSLFFLVGGLLLFALNAFLQRQRRRLLADEEKGGGRL
ncbi:DUF2157 domain-containing protein [Aneurinibacillus sp. REN35]|uniref:DUF2157 domain-containing protein n=1 Tax=Aneurinibacillus sp. REN35 TaxID=3237286 RepID=UPI00352963EA